MNQLSLAVSCTPHCGLTMDQVLIAIDGSFHADYLWFTRKLVAEQTWGKTDRFAMT
jgi:hypothetical protein